MKTARLANTGKACAALLDVSENGIVHMKKHGTDRRTALACQALLHGLIPYGQDEKKIALPPSDKA